MKDEQIEVNVEMTFDAGDLWRITNGDEIEIWIEVEVKIENLL